MRFNLSSLYRHKFSRFIIYLLFLSLLLLMAPNSHATATWNVDISAGSGANVDLTYETGKARLQSDKDFLAHFNDSTTGSKSEAGSYTGAAPTYAAEKFDKGYRARSLTNENMGLSQVGTDTMPPVIFTLGVSDMPEPDTNEIAQMFEGINPDNPSEHYDWYGADYRMTINAIPDLVDTADHSTTAELRDYVKRGHQVGSHGPAHEMFGIDRDIYTNTVIDLAYKGSTATTCTLSYAVDTQIFTITGDGTCGVHNIDISADTKIGEIYEDLLAELGSTNFIINLMSVDYLESYWKGDSNQVLKTNLNLAATVNQDINRKDYSIEYKTVTDPAGLYITTDQFEAKLARSKQDLEDVINGDPDIDNYEANTLVYPSGNHDLTTMDLAKKYYIGAVTNPGYSSTAFRPTFSESNQKNYPLTTGLNLYEIPFYSTGCIASLTGSCLTAQTSWLVKENDYSANYNKTRDLFKDQILGVNTNSSLNPGTYGGITFSTVQYANQQNWINLGIHSWEGLDYNNGSHTATEANAKTYLRATLQAIYEMQQAAELAGKPSPVEVMTLEDAIKYFRTNMGTYYRTSGVNQYNNGYNAYAAMGGNQNYTFGAANAATITEVAKDNAIQTAVNASGLFPEDTPVWDFSTVGGPATWAYTRLSYQGTTGQQFIKDHHYTYSLYVCNPTDGAGAAGNVTLNREEPIGAWGTISDTTCSNTFGTNWTKLTGDFDMSGNSRTGAPYASYFAKMVGFGVPDNYEIYMTGLQILDITTGETEYDGNEFIDYTKKSHVGLNYAVPKVIDYSAGTVGFWWKPFKASTWEQDRPFFETKGVRAYYEAKSGKIKLETYDNTTDAEKWQTLESAWAFAAGTTYHLAFTWDEAAGKGIFVDGASLASDAVTWTALDETSADKLYVGTDYYGFDDAQGYFDELVIYPDAKNESYIDTNLHNAAAALTNGYPVSATYYTQNKDLGVTSQVTDLNWTATTPASTSVKFQICLGMTEAELLTATCYGPTSDADYYTALDQPINTSHDIGVWAKVKAVLESSDADSTPVLNTLTLESNTYSVHYPSTPTPSLTLSPSPSPSITPTESAAPTEEVTEEDTTSSTEHPIAYTSPSSATPGATPSATTEITVSPTPSSSPTSSPGIETPQAKTNEPKSFVSRVGGFFTRTKYIWLVVIILAALFALEIFSLRRQKRSRL